MATTRALVVGIETYANPRNNLPGVSNDVSAFMEILSRFNVTDVEVIRDANATSKNIRTALNALVEGAQAGDVRIFYYSGHGALLPKGYALGDDPDGRDEALVPYEGTTDSLILDNWFGLFLKEKLPASSSFYSVLDCCHSGQLYKRAHIAGLSNNMDDSDEPKAKEMDFSALVFNGNPITIGNTSTNMTVKDFVVDEDLVNSVHIAASQPDTTALVLNIDGARRSVFTWALQQVVTTTVTVGELELLLTAKQAEKTAHHRPFVASRAANKARVLFS
jgi:hypothetical protein